MWYSLSVTIERLVNTTLSNLSEQGEDKLFEEIGKLCAKRVVDHKDRVFSHSGNAYSGDGGVDSFIYNEDYSHFKIAYSIEKNWKRKLAHELKHEYMTNYNGLLFLSSIEIEQRDAEKTIKNLEEKLGIPIRILCKSHLAEMIQKIPECLKLMGIPSELNRIEIEYLASNNQFNNETNLQYFIPRKIISTAQLSKDSTEGATLLSEYVKDPPDVTVMISPAGYGKTGALKQTCNHILRNYEDYYLPPVYLKLTGYYPGALYNMITDVIGNSPDYELKDALLFIDGLDEISNDDLQKLVNDICSWRSNGSHIRKIFLSGRTNEFSDESLNPLGTRESVILIKPSEKEIRDYIDTRIHEDSDRNEIKSFILSNFNDANMFFIEKAIEFFEINRKVPDALWELLEFVSLNDLSSILRSKDFDTHKIEREAFLSIREKRNTIIVQARKLQLECFSHRYVIEYLAAKYLACLTSNRILDKITANNKFILPWMKNTVGLTLSLMTCNESKKTEVKKLFKTLSYEYFNIDALIKCESYNLDNTIKTALIKKSTQYMLDSFDVYRFEKDYSKLFFDPLILYDNLSWLMNLIDKEDKDERRGILFHIVFYLVVENKVNVPRFFTIYLKERLFRFIENNTDYSAISSILYCLASLECCNLFSADDISMLIGFIHSKYWKHGCFNNTCRIIRACNIELSSTNFEKLTDVYFEIAKFTRSRMTAHYVPDQIDDTYNPKPMELQLTDEYHLVALDIFRSNPDILWLTMSHALNNWDDNSDQKLLETFTIALLNVSANDSLPEDKLIIILKLFMINAYGNNAFRSEIIKTNVFLVSQLFQLILKTCNSNSLDYEYQYAFNDFFLCLAKDRNLFLNVLSQTTLSQESFEKLIGIPFCFQSTDNDTINVLTEESRCRVLEYLNNSDLKDKMQIDYQKEQLESSIHKFFSNSDFLDELKMVFKELKKNEISVSDVIEMKRKHTYPAALFFLLKVIDEKFITKEKAIEKWENRTETNTIFLLVHYISEKSLSYSVLNSQEIDFIIKWTVKTLTNYPLRSNEDRLMYAHIYISILMNDHFMSKILQKEVFPIRGSIKGFITSGILRKLDTGIIDSDYASIEYLETYFSRSEILACINSNMDSIFGNNAAMMGVGKYLSEMSNREAIQFATITSIKEKIINYLQINFSKTDYNLSFFETFFDSCGITTDIFPVDLYVNSLEFIDEDNRYNENIANWFLKLYSEKTNRERSHIIKILKRRFNCSKSFNEKKYISEILMNYDHSSFQTFNWYARNLLKDKIKSIKHTLIHNDYYYCNSLLCLPLLISLWRKFRVKTEVRGSTVQHIVNNSFIGIVKDSKHRDFSFSIVLVILNRLQKEEQTDSILRLRNRCVQEYTTQFK